MPYVAVPWVLTWAAHNIKRLDQITRLYDFFIAYEPLSVYYFSAAAILAHRDALLEMDFEDASMFMCRCLDVPPDLDALVQRSAALLAEYPLKRLESLVDIEFHHMYAILVHVFTNRQTNNYCDRSAPKTFAAMKQLKFSNEAKASAQSILRMSPEALAVEKRSGKLNRHKYTQTRAYIVGGMSVLALAIIVSNYMQVLQEYWKRY